MISTIGVGSGEGRSSILKSIAIGIVPRELNLAVKCSIEKMEAEGFEFKTMLKERVIGFGLYFNRAVSVRIDKSVIN